MEIPRVSPGPGARMLVVYAFWLITTPQYSDRFGPFLESIQCEKFIAAATLLAILAQGGLPRVRYRLVGLVLTLFAIMIVSFLTSPFTDFGPCQSWADQYWKSIAYFLMIVHGLRNLGELVFFLRWIVFIVLFYEVHSWKDFLGGGSFVYQQGIKRMTGCWSGGTIGAANEWAAITLCALPFTVWLYGAARGQFERRIAVFATVLSGLSIIYSGTRGAMVAGFLYTAIKLRRHVFRLRTIAVLVAVVAVGAMLAPQALVERYSTSFDFLSSEKKSDLSRDEKIARESAESRIEGLTDGFQMALARPVFGWGPGSSARARKEVNPAAPDLQLHNLYGQVVGELGFIGAAVWLTLLSAAIRGSSIASSTHLLETSAPYQLGVELRKPLIEGLLLLLMYGMFGHILYDFRWLNDLGCLVVLQSALASERDPDPELDEPSIAVGSAGA